jgi:hypothetical protein
MAIKKCLFDRNGNVVDMLYPDPYAVYRDVVTYPPPACWICFILGEEKARQLENHGNHYIATGVQCVDVCKGRKAPTEETRELWVIHGDGIHHEWILGDNVEVVAPPLAILFVSYAGGSGVFASKTAKVKELGIQGQSKRVKIPVFYFRDPIVDMESAIREVLNCFEVALEILRYQNGGNPLEPFRKVALDSATSEWPMLVGLRDNAKELYFLYALRKLAEEDKVEQNLVDTLLESPGLTIAKENKNDLSNYLAFEHENLLIPLECWEILREWEHNPATSAMDKEKIAEKKVNIVKEWLSKYSGAARRYGINNANWRTVKQWAIKDAETWDSTVKVK